MCVFQACPYECLTKKEHHSRFAKMRRGLPKEKIDESIIKLSSKVNWSIVSQLNLEKPVKRNKNRNDDDILEV